MTDAEPLAVADLFRISDWFDGDTHFIEGLISPRELGATVGALSEMDGEDLDPYETPTTQVEYISAAGATLKRKMTHALEELAWSRFVIPLGYLSKVVGGSFKGYQRGFSDMAAHPASFQWQYLPGDSGMKAGDRL